MPAAETRFLSVAATDQGPVRPNNEDRVYADESRGIFLVVDGMGGHEAGEHAAEIAVETIRTRLERQTGAVEQRIREAIALANNAILNAASENPAWKGMACVLTLAVLDGDRFTVGHVGDSRLYQVRAGTIQKITHDHSPVGEREERGELSEAEAMRHPRRNEVFRDVGSESHDPDDRSVPVRFGHPLLQRRFERCRPFKRDPPHRRTACRQSPRGRSDVDHRSEQDRQGQRLGRAGHRR